MSVVTFLKGDSVNLSIEIRGVVNNILTDPTSVKITITKNIIKIGDSSIVKVNMISMNKVSVGKYAYAWNSDEAGIYSVLYTANNSSIITQSIDTFIVT
jgi:hypothetical protein